MPPFPVYQDDRVRVTATLALHPPVFPSFAFRFETEDASIVFSGDTARSDNVARDPGLLRPNPGPDGERPVIEASHRGDRRRPLRPPRDLAQHLPDPLDRGLDVDPRALLHRTTLLLVATGDRPRSCATHLLHAGPTQSVAVQATPRSGNSNPSPLV
jgi:hypothetical protein